MTALDYDAAKAIIDKLSDRQRDVLGAFACGQRVGSAQTIATLERRGLLVASKRDLPGWPRVVVTEYDTPVPVHMAWANWCDEHVTDDGGEE